MVTLLAYQLGCWLRDRTGPHPLAQPVLVAIVLVGTLVVLLDVDYASYADDTALITFVLGPATVALAVPLHRQLDRLRGFVLPLLVAVVAGAVVSVRVRGAAGAPGRRGRAAGAQHGAEVHDHPGRHRRLRHARRPAAADRRGDDHRGHPRRGRRSRAC